MSPNDNVGRIHKHALLPSILCFFVISLISVSSRFYIRIRIQRQFGLDDAILLFGTGCLIAAMVLLFKFVNQLYESEAPVYSPNPQIGPNFIEDLFYFKMASTVALVLTWCSLVAVKFCYLALFKKLVDRIRPMVIYWWLVVIFNAAVSVYGVTVYMVGCPYFHSLKMVQCSESPGITRTVAFSLSQMVLDVVGDFMILFIPCRLIWRIRIGWSHKLALASSLCLTIVVIICTICRMSGLRWKGNVDSTWEIFWQFTAATLGITMTAATAFRSLFVSHQIDKSHGSPWAIERLYKRSKEVMRHAFISRSWRSKSVNDSNTPRPSEYRDIELGRIEHGTITGLRSFISRFGKTKPGTSQVIQSSIVEDDEGTWPLSKKIVERGSSKANDVISV